MSLHPLRLERLKRGWSQYHVSFNTGVPQVHISYAERGYPALNLRQQLKIADFFDLEVGELFSGESDKDEFTNGERRVL